MTASLALSSAQLDSGAAVRAVIVVTMAALAVGCPENATPRPGDRHDGTVSDGGAEVVDTGPRVVPAPTNLIRFNLLDAPDLSTSLDWSYDGTSLGPVRVGDSTFSDVAAGMHAIATTPNAASVDVDLPPRGTAVIAAIGAPDSIELAAFTIDESSISSEAAYLMHASDSLGAIDARLVPDSGAPLVLATGLAPRGQNHVPGVAQGRYTLEIDTNRDGRTDLAYPVAMGDWAMHIVLADLRGTTVAGVLSQRDLGTFFPRLDPETHRVAVVHLVHDVSAIDVRTGLTTHAAGVRFGELTVQDVGGISVYASDDGALLASGTPVYGFWNGSVVFAYGRRDETFMRALVWSGHPSFRPFRPVSVLQLAPSLGAIDVITPERSYPAEPGDLVAGATAESGELLAVDLDRDGTADRSWMMPVFDWGFDYVAAIALDSTGEVALFLFEPDGSVRLLPPTP